MAASFIAFSSVEAWTLSISILLARPTPIATLDRFCCNCIIFGITTFCAMSCSAVAFSDGIGDGVSVTGSPSESCNASCSQLHTVDTFSEVKLVK